MTGELIAVVDIGKTNAKVALIDAAAGVEVWSAKRVNQTVPAKPARQLDIVEIERWLLQTLEQAPGRESVSAIVPIAHGAAAVFLDEAGAVVTAPDYEDPTFNTVDATYARQRDAYEHTLSPELPSGLNLGKQLFFFSECYPDLFAKVACILPYPQYWAWRFSGVMASEVTSLGCHTDLWRPQQRTFSRLALTRNWSQFFPPLRHADEALGVVTPQLAKSTGLPRTCKVACGIHDSNASYLQHVLDRPRGSPFTVVSSGTWTIVMASGADPARLRAARDMLANVDAFGDIVCTARFMGGREYEAIAPSMAVPGKAALASVLHRQVMATPAFACGGPFSAHQGRLSYAGELSEQERAALATLYTVLMTELLLETLGSSGDTIIDGPLAQNPLFGPLLAAVRPSWQVLSGAAYANGARAACHLAGSPRPAIAEPTSFEPLHVAGLGAYRAAWRDLLPRV